MPTKDNVSWKRKIFDVLFDPKIKEPEKNPFAATDLEKILGATDSSVSSSLSTLYPRAKGVLVKRKSIDSKFHYFRRPSAKMTPEQAWEKYVALGPAKKKPGPKSTKGKTTKSSKPPSKPSTKALAKKKAVTAQVVENKDINVNVKVTGGITIEFKISS